MPSQKRFDDAIEDCINEAHQIYAHGDALRARSCWRSFAIRGSLDSSFSLLRAFYEPSRRPAKQRGT